MDFQLFENHKNSSKKHQISTKIIEHHRASSSCITCSWKSPLKQSKHSKTTRKIKKKSRGEISPHGGFFETFKKIYPGGGKFAPPGGKFAPPGGGFTPIREKFILAWTVYSKSEPSLIKLNQSNLKPKFKKTRREKFDTYFAFYSILWWPANNLCFNYFPEIMRWIQIRCQNPKFLKLRPNFSRIALFPLYFAFFDPEFLFFDLLPLAKNCFVCYFLEFQEDYESEVKFEFSTFLSNWESNSRSKT